MLFRSAIANAKNRNASLKNLLWRARGRRISNRTRSSRENDSLWSYESERLFSILERGNFTIDARFTHPTRDQLRDLRAKIDNQDLIMSVGNIMVEGFCGFAHALP